MVSHVPSLFILHPIAYTDFLDDTSTYSTKDGARLIGERRACNIIYAAIAEAVYGRFQGYFFAEMTPEVCLAGRVGWDLPVHSFTEHVSGL